MNISPSAKNRGAALAVAAAFGLLAAACGSDDEKTTPTPAPANPSTTVRTPAELKGLDASFGTNGVLPVPLGTDHDRFMSVAAGADGKLYASGFVRTGSDTAVSVTRFNADGTLDTTYGTGGTATVNVVTAGTAEVGRTVIVDKSGKAVVVTPFEKDPAASGDAAKDLDVAVVRFDAKGAPDSTFGTNGVAKIDFGAGKAVNATTYVADSPWGLTEREGGYAVFGTTPNQTANRTDADFVIAGLTAAGALDSGFGTAGKLVVDLDASGDSARNIIIQKDGKLLATGYTRDGDDVVSPVLIRASAAGKLDTTFGTNGVANHKVLPGVGESYQVGIQGDAYVLAGYGRGADSNEKVDMIVYRFTADGSWDKTFGTDGITRVDLKGEDDRARNLVVLPDDRILAVGSGKLTADNLDGLVALFDADGKPVASFGENGRLLVDLGGPNDTIYGATVTADGSAVYLAGYKGAATAAGTTDKDDAVLARIAL